MKKMITVHISSVKFKLSNFLLNPSKLVKPFEIEETEVCQYLSLFTLIMDSHMTQCPRTDLNKRSLPRPKTTTACLYPLGLKSARIEILHSAVGSTT